MVAVAVLGSLVLVLYLTAWVLVQLVAGPIWVVTVLVLTPYSPERRGRLILRNSHPALPTAPVPGQAAFLRTACHSATPRRPNRATINQKV
jgi:hypothetical protein